MSALLEGADFDGAVVLGHLHWDHIIGLPFFAAADRPGAKTQVFLPDQGVPASTLVGHVMVPPYFPIGPDELRGSWTFSTYGEGIFDAGGFSVLARDIPHKGGRTMGLRISDGRHSIAYLSDHAPQELGAGPDGIGAYHEAALELADGVDVLIHDSQYTAVELPVLGSFGHAAAEYSVALAIRAKAKRVLLFHHDPGRTDAGVDDIVADCRAGAAVPHGEGVAMRIDAAREGLVINL